MDVIISTINTEDEEGETDVRTLVCCSSHNNNQTLPLDVTNICIV